MKRILIPVVMLVSLILPGKGFAYIEQTDIVLDGRDNAIYMIGSVFNRLTWTQSDLREDSFKIYKIDLKNNGKVLFYEGESKSMDRLVLSPDNNSIAVVRRENYRTVDIFIIDKKLKIGVHTIHEPAGIITYVWSPDSKKIAYLAGTLGEKGKVNAKGVWIYDLENKEKKKIAVTAQNIEWLPTGDLCLYIEYFEYKDGRRQAFYKTQIYADKTDGIITENKGVNLSQDARYSTDPRYIGIGELMEENKVYIDFFNLKEGKTILGSSLDGIFQERTRILWGPILWLKENRLIVERAIRNSLDYDISICDIVNNKELQIVRGRIVGVNSDRSKFVIYSEKKKFITVKVP